MDANSAKFLLFLTTDEYRLITIDFSSTSDNVIMQVQEDSVIEGISTYDSTITTLYGVVGSSDIFVHHLTTQIMDTSLDYTIGFVQNLNDATRETPFWRTTSTTITVSFTSYASASSSVEMTETSTTISDDDTYDSTDFSSDESAFGIEMTDFIEDSQISISKEWWRDICTAEVNILHTIYSRCTYNAPLDLLSGLNYWSDEAAYEVLNDCDFDSMLDGRAMDVTGRGNCLPRLEGPPTNAENNPLENGEYMLTIDSS